MGFGQYSAQGIARKSKKDMLAEIASELQADGKPREVMTSRLVARNTIEYRMSDGTLRVRLHSTDIFTRLPNGTVIINTGGWNTMTTRGRINAALQEHKPGFVVYTGRGQLSVSRREPPKSAPFNAKVTISRGGLFYSDIDSGEAENPAALRKDINRYMAKLRELGVPKESGGDPWVVADPVTHKYRADQVRAWLRDPDTQEPYVFLTFICNAYLYAGVKPEHLGYHLHPDARPDMQFVCRRVRRYIRACLGLAA